MQHNPNKSARGFTLLELLVVLVIVAVMAGLAIFSAQDSPARKLQREARALAALINTAADESVMQSRELGLVIDAQGYRFVALDPATKSWQPLRQKPLSEHHFDEKYAVNFQLDGEHIDEATRVRLQKFIAQDAGDTDADMSGDANKPSLLMLSSGEITPFALTLQNNVAAYTLHSDGFNTVAVTAASELAGQGR